LGGPGPTQRLRRGLTNADLNARLNSWGVTNGWSRRGVGLVILIFIVLG
jgi:hypothetical protein